MKNKLLTPRQKRIKLVLKWACVFLIFFLGYLFMTAPRYELAKPLIMIPAAVCVAMKEDILISGLTGVFGGFLLDAAMGKISGYNAIVMLVCCTAASLLFMYLMRQNLFSVLLITAAISVIQGLLDFLFYYAMWSEPHAGKVFVSYYLLAWVFTLLWTPVVYFLFRLIWKWFGDNPRVFPEERTEWVTRE